jgi:hypothetical protein
MNRRGFIGVLAAAIAARRIDFSAWSYLSPAPLGGGFVSLAEFARRDGHASSARARAIILEILSDSNTILEDMEWIES